MPIIIAAVVTWIAITVFCLVPKKLDLFQIIFLFCIDTIFELSIFSIFHINLHYIVVESGAANGIADLMFRLIELPLLLVVTSNLLLYTNRLLKWCGVIAIVLFTLVVQQVLVQIGMIMFQHGWNIFYSGVGVWVNIAISRLMTCVITSLDKKETA